ncbi:hypothetical protein [Paludisphaera borealis]|uniref:Uncharacterized protein n=1 Tax=Paludisphaera borealis TaxID=1387353 RepID=A0A1U7CYV3_9BACT|nr:hypothetical protein [Paludisphaera borealis]APW64137.1 hypothetical protein BSF38_05729 [Paludisphaera borealis]
MALSIRPSRRASTLLEVQIAFAVLGVGLAGLCPFVVMQYRQVRLLEQRFEADSYEFKNLGRPVETRTLGRVYYLVPWRNPWARKLTARACASSTSDNPLDAGEAAAVPSSVHVKLKNVAPLLTDGVATEVEAIVEVD